MMKAGKQAFSLAELLVGLVVCGIVVLMIGAMGTIAVKSYSGLETQSGADSDDLFVQQAIRTAVRGSAKTPVSTNAAFSLVSPGPVLVLDTPSNTQYFSLIGGNLAYTNAAQTSRILTGIASPAFTVTGDTTLVTIGLTYTKSGVFKSFSVETVRRNP